ncbi:hypothetical protein [Fimbriiglobus ruber]|uniref:Lipoprotein n=1 Tax=Fimbriiglobus ruber TaxID=1908690 RepID=A0A225DDQ8_9BACT|nr:hypothetical protein [Fimbriiglobus ruber]OWK39690.1 hypothetical protein FRUB_05580 [Fimbriiglobus ruber]
MGAFAVAAGFALTAGCGESGPKKYDVSGALKYDGREVADGEIVFFPEDKSAGPEAGKITNGKYTLRAREGRNRVEIRAIRKVPGKKGPMGEDWVENFIPAAYNEKTQLTADVGPGKTTYDFDLTK